MKTTLVTDITLPVLSINRHRLTTDGEGVTTLVASFGCPLKCKYCINKEAWNPDYKNRCVNMRPDQLYEKLKIDDLYFVATKGGITFGGGESLLYADFIVAFRKICKSRWKINVETSLNVPRENLQKVLPVVDFFIVDIKDMNPLIYKEYTGSTNEKVMENLKLLIQEKSPDCIRIRVPKIPNHNEKEDLNKSVLCLQELGFTNIEVFSYVIKDKK